MVATLGGEAGDDRQRDVEIQRLEEMFTASSVDAVPALSQFAMIDLQLGPGDTYIQTVNKQGSMPQLMGRFSVRKVGLQQYN